MTGGMQGGLVDEVGEIGTDEAWRLRRYHREIQARSQLHGADMHFQNFLPSFEVGTVENDLTIEAARPQQSGVQDFRPVGRRQDHDTFLGIEAVKLCEELVQGLLALVVAAHDRADASRLP